MQLISCHIGGRSAKSLEGIILCREHVELYAVVQCVLSAFEKQTNLNRKLLKSGKHVEIFPVKALHNTRHIGFADESFNSVHAVLTFVLEFQKLIVAKIDLSHIV
jgi:hypothetical protein